MQLLPHYDLENHSAFDQQELAYMCRCLADKHSIVFNVDVDSHTDLIADSLAEAQFATNEYLLGVLAVAVFNWAHEQGIDIGKQMQKVLLDCEVS